MRVQLFALVVASALLVPGCDQPSEPAGLDGSSDMGVPDGASPDVGDDGSMDAEPDTSDTVDLGPDTRDLDARPDVPDSGVDADAGCTGSADSDADGLTDCEERDLCTDPYDGDTDDDGLSDREEIAEGTNPCKADTDGDGVDDRTELQLALDPDDQDTFNDGTSDADRWRVSACDEDERVRTEGSVAYANTTANWKFVVSASFSNYETLRLAGVDAPVAAAVYGDSLTGAFGFLLSRSASNGRTSPATSLADFVKPEIDDLTGGFTDNVIYGTTGGAFETHDGKSAAIGRYLVKLPNPKTTKKLRESLLDRLAPDAMEITGGLPSTIGQSYETFWIYTSVIFRQNSAGPDQALFSVAVSPESVYESRSQVRWQLKDLTNTTAIAEAGDQVLPACEGFVPSGETPKAEFYWVIDQSGSMKNDATKVASFGDAFVQEVARTQLDYRMGVTNIDPQNVGRLYDPPGWTRRSAEFATAINEGVVECADLSPPTWECSGFQEYGLQSAMDGIQYMTGPSATPEDRIRDGAEIITIFLTDDRDYTLDELGQPITQYKNFFPGRTTAYAITGTGGSCGAKLGAGYRDVAQWTGGKFASICSENLESILDDIVYTAAGKTSTYQFSRTPISSSLVVLVDGEFIPRSRTDGFAYFPSSNGIAFFGSVRPQRPPEDSPYAPEYVVVQYDYFLDRCKESGEGAQNCEPE